MLYIARPAITNNKLINNVEMSLTIILYQEYAIDDAAVTSNIIFTEFDNLRICLFVNLDNFDEILLILLFLSAVSI